MQRIYTRNGDQGTTALINGTQVDKDHPLIELNGLIDTCNSYLGVVRSVNSISYLDLVLKKIQGHLLQAGAEVSLNGSQNASCPTLKQTDIDALERIIDDVEEHLPPLTQFILPAGNLASAHLHVARTLSRSVERGLATLETSWVSTSALQPYFNRLSDALFVLARYAQHQSGEPEEVWNPTKD